jgi:hypothetical protein
MTTYAYDYDCDYDYDEGGLSSSNASFDMEAEHLRYNAKTRD